MPNNNDIVRGLRYALDLPDLLIAAWLRDRGLPAEPGDIAALLARDAEPEFRECDDRTLAAVLDGLIVERRGPAPEGKVPRPGQLSNNMVLRKIRIALELDDEAMLLVFRFADFSLSKNELSAFFRKPGHPNYKYCGDQIVRYFLRGLAHWARGQS